MHSDTFSRVRGVSLPPTRAKESSVLFHNSTAIYSTNKLLFNSNNYYKVGDLPPTYVENFHALESVKRMKYKQLEKTDIVISKLSFGSSSFGGLYGPMQFKIIEEILATALKSGINFIDTSYWYCQKRSEEVLGKLLPKFPRRSYYIATKVGRYELDYARNMDYRADKVLQSLTNSIKKMKVQYIDVCFLQIHDADFNPSESIIIHETLPALEIAKQMGKIKYIGITGYPLEKLKHIVETSTTRIDIVQSYCHGNLHDNSLGKYIPFFEQRGISVINAGVFGNGLLTKKGPKPWHPASDYIKNISREAVEYCLSKNISIERLALDYSTTFKGVASCLIGCESVEELQENLALIWSPIGLSEKERRVKDRIMRRYFDKLENANWEGTNVRRYWKMLKQLGLPNLATHKFSSMESISSTLTSFSAASSMRSRSLVFRP